MEGWVCPRCQSVWSPLTEGCRYCNSMKSYKSGAGQEIARRLSGAGMTGPTFVQPSPTGLTEGGKP